MVTSQPNPIDETGRSPYTNGKSQTRPPLVNPVYHKDTVLYSYYYQSLGQIYESHEALLKANDEAHKYNERLKKANQITNIPEINHNLMIKQLLPDAISFQEIDADVASLNQQVNSLKNLHHSTKQSIQDCDNEMAQIDYQIKDYYDEIARLEKAEQDRNITYGIYFAVYMVGFFIALAISEGNILAAIFWPFIVAAVIIGFVIFGFMVSLSDKK